MKVALTGASGFIGRKAAKILLDRGYVLSVLVRKTAFELEHDPRVEVVQGDLDDTKALSRLVSGAQAVVHCAGLVAARSRAEFFAVNVNGTANIAKAAEAEGVLKFLLMSSMAAREPQLSDYAASKRAGEEALRETTRLPWDILRPTGVYGPEDMQILPLFKMLQNGLALMPAGPEARLSIIHVDDLAEGIAAWVQNARPISKIYEIAGPRADDMTWKQMFERSAAAMGVNPRFVRPPKPLLMTVGAASQLGARVLGRTPFVTPGKVAEICHNDWLCHDRNFESVTGWSPHIRFEDGLRETLAWYHDHGLLKLSKAAA